MTKIKEIICELENIAPPILQESYDNSTLITGDKELNCTGVLLTLDCTEEVVAEAISKGCNLILAHHPIIFSGLKSLTGKTYIERTVIKAIKNDICIYACHTNLDNVKHGVNKKICNELGLVNTKILSPTKTKLLALQVFVPEGEANSVKNALHKAGAGNIGHYSHCSFTSSGEGQFTPRNGSKPKLGKLNQTECVKEEKIEVVLALEKKQAVLKALFNAHPYEEPAYFLTQTETFNPDTGSGMIGELKDEISLYTLLEKTKKAFNTGIIKHTEEVKPKVKKIAVCGGSGSFLLKQAIYSGADVFITSDFKYHEFFDAEKKIVIADIGHYETEHKTKELFFELLSEKFTNIALVFSKTNTNPVKYY